MSPWSAFASYRPATKDLTWTTIEASTVKNSPRDFRLCLLPSALPNDTGHRALPRHEALPIASNVKGPPRPRLYISPASQPTRPRLRILPECQPYDRGFAHRQQVTQHRPIEPSRDTRLYQSPAMSKDHPDRGFTYRQQVNQHGRGSAYRQNANAMTEALHIASKSPVTAEALHICQNATTPPSFQPITTRALHVAIKSPPQLGLCNPTINHLFL
jgi:hypothetical protein